MNEPSPLALFRFSVLGGLLHRELARGELQTEIARLATREYDIPGTTRTRIGPKTLEGWYYAYRRQGLAGLEPKPREDRGLSKIDPRVQEAILAAKRDNPRRSIRQLRLLMEQSGQVAKGTLSRSAIHRLGNCSCVALPPASLQSCCRPMASLVPAGLPLNQWSAAPSWQRLPGICGTGMCCTALSSW
jgi:hypothetical protein